MDPERWQRMWSIFEEALGQSAAERMSFVETACAGDPMILQTVEELLRADQEAAGFLDRPMVELPPERGSRAAPVKDEVKAIGPYRLLRQVGQGGMGAVYLAMRDDDTFRRRVVIKLIRRGMEHEETVRRMRTERQILASLDHPNIAKLYDGGTTGDHLPYFVMEYVEGMPIDTYCDLNRLSVDERLTLFREVCSAVHYAHQNLVVHRDLKPSNILITAEGHAKLLDFGIAKLLNPELGTPEIESTATWHRVLTPHYASPEQIRGKLVTTTSDIYSLGVLLCKLLSGDLPHRFPSRSPREIEWILRQTEPARPSALADAQPVVPSTRDAEEETSPRPGAEEIARNRGTSPQRLRRQLVGDLDSIVLKALRSSPHNRYSSVEHFAADVERYQNGLAVLARRGNWRYRGAKFLRRHRTAATATAAVLILLVGFVVAMVWQSARVVRERDRVLLERDKKQSVLALMLDVFGVNDPTVSDREKATMTVSEALARSGPPLEQRLRKHPDVRAEIQQAKGIIYRHLGQHDLARDQLEEALHIRRGLFGDEHRLVAETRGVLAYVRQEQGELEEAESLTRQAVETLRQPGVAASAADLLAPLNALVGILCEKGRYDLAEPLAREALVTARQVTDQEQQLVFALNSLAVIHNSRGDYQEAAQFYRQSLEVLSSVWGEDHVSLVIPLNNLSVALRHQGRLEEAEATYLRALALQEKALGPSHPNLAYTLNNLGGVLFAKESYPQAEGYYRRALSILHDSYGPDHRNGFLVTVRLQAARLRQGESQAAEEELRSQIERWRPELGDEHGFIALGEGVLGDALVAQGRYDEAEPLLIGSFQKLLRQSQKRRKVEALNRLVELYETLQRPDQIAKYRAMLTSE